MAIRDILLALPFVYLLHSHQAHLRLPEGTSEGAKSHLLQSE